LLRANGESLLHRAARLAVESHLQPICVVLGSRASELTRELNDFDVQIVINPNWQEGMAASLRTGVEHLTSTSTPPHHILVLLCDQMGVTSTHLNALLAAAEDHPKKIIASFYRNRSGVPAIFPAVYFAELLKIHGDRGARHLLQRHASDTVLLPLAEGELDIDSPEDVERAGLNLPLSSSDVANITKKVIRND
jgi:molybdenum cofactor cytidylyltransferase